MTNVVFRERILINSMLHLTFSMAPNIVFAPNICRTQNTDTGRKTQTQLISTLTQFEFFSIRQSDNSAFYVKGKYKQNSRKLWKLIQEILNKTPNKGESIKAINIDGVPSYDPTTITNEFCKHFSSIGETFANKIPLLQKKSQNT